MNSTISTTREYAYHTFTNVEFTGVFDKVSYMREYFHIFIKYGDKVYMDVGIHDIVISFDELKKNKYWKHYYDLSLMLANDKHMVVQDLKYNISDHLIYDDTMFWNIDISFKDGCLNTQAKRGYYYKINPYDLENMEYASKEDLNNFSRIYTTTNGIIVFDLFDTYCVIYNNLAIDYNVRMMENELEELLEYFEDKMHIVNLTALRKKHAMNIDVLMIIYKNLLGANDEPNKNMAYILANIESATEERTTLELVTQIVAT